MGNVDKMKYNLSREMRNAEKMSHSRGALDTMRRILKKEGEESIENQCEQKGS